VPVHPSAEVNFALPRQFSVPVSSLVTPVVFGHLISNSIGAEYLLQEGFRQTFGWQESLGHLF
jgi:hypothetical protein